MAVLLPNGARAGILRYRQTYLLNRFSIAGFFYYEGSKVLHHLKSGDRLVLRAEPTNPHDEFAVEIFFGPDKLGYVPRSDNRHISRLLQQGAALRCKVIEVKDSDEWQNVRVAVSLEA